MVECSAAVDFCEYGFLSCSDSYKGVMRSAHNSVLKRIRETKLFFLVPSAMEGGLEQDFEIWGAEFGRWIKRFGWAGVVKYEYVAAEVYVCTSAGYARGTEFRWHPVVSEGSGNKLELLMQSRHESPRYLERITSKILGTHYFQDTRNALPQPTLYVPHVTIAKDAPIMCFRSSQYAIRGNNKLRRKKHQRVIETQTREYVYTSKQPLLPTSLPHVCDD